MHKTMDSPLSIGFTVACDHFFLMLEINLPLHYASLYLVLAVQYVNHYLSTTEKVLAPS